ncbi:stage V sporulation protein AC [Anoxybacter fermentans]|uniref:Stage V sporulation protein AC n=2 Tax=Anoxybacter fermentans TaxID=1323375 RepID=A0A3Q9HSU9_9FIRM|nr:stage V sporulation protein AC [Anoxybacter fermentans]
MIQKYRQKKPKLVNLIFAFLVGGIICAIGEGIIQLLKAFGMNQDQAGPMATIILIFIGSFLTGIGVYDEIGQIGGAGAAVPVTGFANAIVSPAMEFRQEGWILGLGAKMYIVAGPVLTYGMVTAFLMGVLKIIFKF